MVGPTRDVSKVAAPLLRNENGREVIPAVIREAF
jgi:hypothetical protein